MARTPVKRISYSACFHNEEEGIPFCQCDHASWVTLKEARQQLEEAHRRNYPRPFLVKMTEERMMETT